MRLCKAYPLEKSFFIGGDLNGHVGTSRYGFDSEHGRFDFREKNEPSN